MVFVRIHCLICIQTKIIKIILAEMDIEKKEVVQIVFAGPPASGKSCLANGYTDLYKTTIGVDVVRKNYKIGEKQVDFEIWDISASMTFNHKNLQYSKKGQVVALFFAVSDRNSFLECQNLAEVFLKEDRMRFDAKIVLVGTKTDLPREVMSQQGQQAGLILKGSASSPTRTYFEVSAKTEKGALQNLCRGIYSVLKDPTIRTVSELEQEISPQAPAPVELPAFEIKNVGQQKAGATQPPAYNKLFKVLLMGDEATGKSAILNRFVKDEMLIDYVPTIGVDFATKILDISGEMIKLQGWDTAGQKRFQVITSAYIKGCQAIILVYDCSNVQTFMNLSDHLQQVAKYATNPEKTFKIVVANKIDKERKVSSEEGKQFALENGCQYMEVSAMQMVNVNELFMTVGDWLAKEGTQNL